MRGPVLLRLGNRRPFSLAEREDLHLVGFADHGHQLVFWRPGKAIAEEGAFNQGSGDRLDNRLVSMGQVDDSPQQRFFRCLTLRGRCLLERERKAMMLGEIGIVDHIRAIERQESEWAGGVRRLCSRYAMDVLPAARFATIIQGSLAFDTICPPAL